MLLGPSQWYQEKSIQALGNGSFLLSTVSRKKTDEEMGASTGPARKGRRRTE